MTPRRRTLAALVAGVVLGLVVPPLPAADAAPTKAQQAAAAKKKKAAAAKKKKAAAARKKKAAAAKKRRAAAAKRRRAAARRGGRVATAKRTNMPRGWAWPPSAAMTDAGAACTAELDALGVPWQAAPAEPKIATPVQVPSLVFGGVQLVSTYRKGPHVMDCHLALALVTHGLELHAQGVRELHFSRIYEYSTVRVNGRHGASLSRHALGLAIDVRALVDDTGHKAVVLDDYPKGDPLLLRVENYLNDCGGFRTILTPRNDPASHDDHFHLEAVVDYDVPARPPS